MFRNGDTLARTLLYEATVVLLTRVERASPSEDWVHVSPLWTLQRLYFGPDVAAAYADRGENRDAGTAITPAASERRWSM